MPIQLLQLIGPSSLYALAVGDATDEERAIVRHLYWGGVDASYATTLTTEEASDEATGLAAHLATETVAQPFDPYIALGAGQHVYESRNTLMLEVSVAGCGDFRVPSIELEWVDDGARTAHLAYVSHRWVRGKPVIDAAQPAFYVEDTTEATSLCVTLADLTAPGLRVHLWYHAYAAYDVIVRRTIIENATQQPVRLKRAHSASIDLPPAQHGYFVTSLSGAWGRERHVVSTPINGPGLHTIASRRGASSHQHSPFVVVSDGPLDETAGTHFAVGLVYSGSFAIETEMTQTGHLRIALGIEPSTLTWDLQPGESFTTPEAVLATSAHGMAHISHHLHRIVRTRLVRGHWRDLPRPILVNSWEAMYFDVTEDNIVIKLAEPAARLGFDLVVVDDGWFGARLSDQSSLGDWTVNTDKFPGGLRGCADRVNALGLQFGIWMEMISIDSDLHRAHPDWPLHVVNRPRSEGRHQLVLDLSRSDVQEYVVKTVCGVLASANIAYLKWDFNRSLTEVGSATLPAHRQGEVHHRFVLGLYWCLEQITKTFPKVLIETCSGGGGRFDYGMLHYSPQIWTSDNTDAIGRLRIQYGTMLAYPVSAMSCHVSKSPNHQNGRTTSMQTRAHVAMGGIFGYELDLLELEEEELQHVRSHIALYREIEEIVRTGDVYRLASPFAIRHDVLTLAAWMFVLPDRNRAVVFAFNNEYFELVKNPPRLVLQGLDPLGIYEMSGSIEGNRSGGQLMSIGLVPDILGDAKSIFVQLRKIDTVATRARL